MKRTLLLKIISLLVLLSIIFSLSLTLTSCDTGRDPDDEESEKDDDDKSDEKEDPDDGKEDPSGGNEDEKKDPDDGGEDDKKDPDGGNEDGKDPEEDKEDEKIVVPPVKDYNRDTIDFKNMEYVRPDMDATIAAFEEIVAMIEANAISFEDQMSAIDEVYAPYADVLTMYSLAEIHSSIDTSDEFWATENEFMTTSYPKFAQVIEDMYVAAANSANAERFEEEYFGDGLIEEYKDGGIYTDELVELLADEAELESKYSALSTATVTVEYKHHNDTVDNILNYYEGRYGADSVEFAEAYEALMALFEEKYTAQSKSIFISLVKVRRLIADELDYESYAQLGYEELGHDYSTEQMSAFIDDVVNYAIPIYINLYSQVFYSFFENNLPSELSKVKLVNTVYEIMQAADPELGEIFAYMLQYNLYDIELMDVNRFEGAYTTYINNYNAPFILMSSYGDVLDYSTLIHEFGHFADSYLNYGANAPMDTLEISSQALELLMIKHLSKKIASKDALMIKYNALLTVLDTLIYQGFYARIEENIYKLSYDQITEKNLNAIVKNAAEEFGFNPMYANDISIALIPHTILYPFYVQSYCTSVIPAVELYFIEKESEGEGFKSYKNLILRDEYGYTFEEELRASGLTSPFEDGHVKWICEMIHYEIFGSYYFKDTVNGGNQDAA